MKRNVAGIAAAVFLIVLAGAGMWTYYRNSMARISESVGSMAQYARHFLFVCDDGSEMWQEVFQAAKAYAASSDAILEWAGDNAPVARTLAECIDIGISSKVDGIILVPDGSEEIRSAIRRASGAEIPVVNLVRDVDDSGRVSFVGVTSSRQGELIGEQVLSLAPGGEGRVCLLADTANSETASNLLFSQIARAVSGGENGGSSLSVYMEKVDSRNDFEAEEIIRNVLLSETPPDILICVNSVQTECVRSALVDYNMVEDVKVIGYYASAAVLSALRNDLLSAVITCSTEEIGEKAVTALDEYLDTGHVSDYFDISLTAVTAENVNRYIRAQHQDR